MPRVLVLNDTRDQQNWGSQLCAQALVDILSARVPDAEISTYPSSWFFQQHRMFPRWLGARAYRTDRVGRFARRFTKPLAIAPWIVDEYDYIADRWMRGEVGPGPAEYLRDLANVDAVVFNAEGCTYRTNRVAVMGLFMLWLARTRYGVPSFFLNGTVALTDVDRVLPGMVRHTFPVLDGISVREPWSLRNVAHYVPGARVELVPDSAFAYEPDVNGPVSPETAQLLERLSGAPYCVFSSSMLPIDFSRTRARSALVRLIESLQGVVPQVVLAGKDRGDQFLEEVAKLTGVHFMGADRSYLDLTALLQSAAFLVSGRYHNIILGAIVGCPSVGLTSTSHKIEGLCELLDGVIGQPFDATDIRSSTPAIVAAAKTYVADRDEFRERLLALSARCREATATMGDIVRSSLSAPAPGHETALSSTELQ
jgi:polysaccharide pyruvyl transferase WcaK-like protein